jgi:hypothetical protein
VKCRRQRWKYFDVAGGSKNGVENFGAGTSWKMSAGKIEKALKGWHKYDLGTGGLCFWEEQ